MSTMVYPREEKLEKLSQEEIISNTKLVIQGLEALKNEHNSILHSLLETIKCLKKDEEANLVHEKSNLLRKSVEMIELGLGEAQVRLGFQDVQNCVFQPKKQMQFGHKADMSEGEIQRVKVYKTNRVSSQLPHSILSLHGDDDSLKISPSLNSATRHCNSLSLVTVTALQCCLCPR